LNYIFKKQKNGERGKQFYCKKQSRRKKTKKKGVFISANKEENYFVE